MIVDGAMHAAGFTVTVRFHSHDFTVTVRLHSHSKSVHAHRLVTHSCPIGSQKPDWHQSRLASAPSPGPDSWHLKMESKWDVAVYSRTLAAMRRGNRSAIWKCVKLLKRWKLYCTSYETLCCRVLHMLTQLQLVDHDSCIVAMHWHCLPAVCLRVSSLTHRINVVR